MVCTTQPESSICGVVFCCSIAIFFRHVFEVAMFDKSPWHAPWVCDLLFVEGDGWTSYQQSVHKCRFERCGIASLLYIHRCQFVVQLIRMIVSRYSACSPSIPNDVSVYSGSCDRKAAISPNYQEDVGKHSQLLRWSVLFTTPEAWILLQDPEEFARVVVQALQDEQRWEAGERFSWSGAVHSLPR